MENIVYLNLDNKSKLIDEAAKGLSNFLKNEIERGVPMEALIGLLDVYKTNITLEILAFEDK